MRRCNLPRVGDSTCNGSASLPAACNIASGLNFYSAVMSPYNYTEAMNTGTSNGTRSTTNS